MNARQASRRGRRDHLRTFSADEIRDIRHRRDDGESISAIAYSLDVWPVKIWRIVKRQTYADVD